MNYFKPLNESYVVDLSVTLCWCKSKLVLKIFLNISNIKMTNWQQRMYLERHVVFGVLFILLLIDMVFSIIELRSFHTTETVVNIV